MYLHGVIPYWEQGNYLCLSHMLVSVLSGDNSLWLEEGEERLLPVFVSPVLRQVIELFFNYYNYRFHKKNHTPLLWEWVNSVAQFAACHPLKFRGASVRLFLICDACSSSISRHPLVSFMCIFLDTCLVESLCYETEGCWFEFRWIPCLFFFSIYLISGRNMALALLSL
jgi:hypothetical protein